MPHDCEGRPVGVGDEVTIAGIVTHVDQGEDFCNVTLVTTLPLHPGTTKSTIMLNARQVCLVRKAGSSHA